LREDCKKKWKQGKKNGWTTPRKGTGQQTQSEIVKFNYRMRVVKWERERERNKTMRGVSECEYEYVVYAAI